MKGKTPVLEGQLRPNTGSKYAKRVRRGGKLPAVIYGHKQDPAHIALDLEAVTELLHGGAHLVEVAIESGKSETCLIKDIQYDHLGDYLIHMDLARVDLSEEVTVSVSIEITGNEQCPGLKESGAFLEHPLTDLEVKCRADAIPGSITVDISELELNASITVADLTLPSGVKTDIAADTVLAAIHVIKEAEEVEGEEGEATGAEPEVIAEKKEEEASE